MTERLRAGRGSSLGRSFPSGPTAPPGDGGVGGGRSGFQKTVTSARYLCQMLGDQSGPPRAEVSGRFISAQGLREMFMSPLNLKETCGSLTFQSCKAWAQRWALSQDPAHSQGQAQAQVTLHLLSWLAAFSTENGVHWSTPPWAHPHNLPTQAGLRGQRYPPAQGLGDVR